LNTPIKSLRP